MYFKQELGKYGEEKACEYLKKNNYRIIEKNFLCKQGEIDIIALSSLKELVFVEVKTRRNIKYGMPCEAVTPKKIKNIISSSKYYIFKNRFYNLEIRYDVIEVFAFDTAYYINHIKNAF